MILKMLVSFQTFYREAYFAFFIKLELPVDTTDAKKSANLL